MKSRIHLFGFLTAGLLLLSGCGSVVKSLNETPPLNLPNESALINTQDESALIDTQDTFQAECITKKDIVDTAASAHYLNTLVAAVGAAGLVETLKGPGPFTVFAPTDAAFANLPEGTVATLLKPENKPTLVNILTYHVVPYNIRVPYNWKQIKVRTVQGSEIKIKKNGCEVTVNDAKILNKIIASNGVIYIIDTVLTIPKSKTNQ